MSLSYEQKMLQMKKMLGKRKQVNSAEQGIETSERNPSFIKPSEPIYVSEWEHEGLTVIRNDYGVVFKRVVKYPLHYRHGHYELKQLFTVQKKWARYEGEHPYKTLPAETLLFFDTETTGLKGVGTQIFLLGYLKFDGDAFVLTQYVLADPSHEVAFLTEGNWWKVDQTIVTYNGKSFDWPQLETRWTLNRAHLPKLVKAKHIDLLHSTKRIWKNDMDKMKLTAVEKEKLGFERVGDIPGFLAPVIYLDAVKSGNASSLMKVLQHNEWDLLSLITLYIHSSLLLFDQNLAESSTTYTNIGKWYGDLKQAETGAMVLEKVTDQFKQHETGMTYYHLGLQQKKLGDVAKAIISFEKCVPYVNMETKVKASEQVAMLAEHKLKDYVKALTYTECSIAYTNLLHHWSKEKLEKQLKQLEKRHARIIKKSSKPI